MIGREVEQSDEAGGEEPCDPCERLLYVRESISVAFRNIHVEIFLIPLMNRKVASCTSQGLLVGRELEAGYVERVSISVIVHQHEAYPVVRLADDIYDV